MTIDFWYNNMDIVFFIYGCAFFVLGLSIIMQLRITRTSEFKLLHILSPLAWFGLIHAASAFLDMFTWNKIGCFYYMPLNSIILGFSFLAVFIFGYKLINIGSNKVFGSLFILAIIFEGIPSREIVILELRVI